METLSLQMMKVSKSEIVTYRYWIPESYTNTKKYPLLVFLHGAGERGTDGLHPRYPDQVNFMERILKDDELRENFIIFAPQCPNEYQWVQSDWTPGTYDFEKTPISKPLADVCNILKEKFLEALTVDMTRIYVTGLSMGGFGTWDIVARNPDIFAAMMPVCGGCDEKLVDLYKDMPIWICHGAADDCVFPYGERRMYAALVLAGAKDVHYTEYYKRGHDAWNPAYADDEIFEWLLSRRKTI